MQREQDLKDCLSEHQMHAHGTQRLQQRRRKALVSKEALAAMERQRVGSDEEKKKVPSINYLIKHMQPYSFQGKLYLLIAFESRTVRVFHFNTGNFEFEF